MPSFATTVPHRFIVAPMVGASEPAFRILCRNYGADLCYSPMLPAHQLANPTFRQEHFSDTELRILQPRNDNDTKEESAATTTITTPVVCHVSCNDPEEFAAAAVHAQAAGCVALDLNLGCPQRTAYVGQFGSYLLDDPDRIVRIVRAGVQQSSRNRLPITVKIRLLSTLQATIELCRQLCKVGVSLIAIHARYRASWERKGPGARDGPAHLDQVAVIQKELHREYPQVKIITNGNTITWEDVQENLQQTQADGLMSAEGILDHPALFLQRYGTDPERPVTVIRLSDKMRKLVTKLWTLALKEVNTSKVDTKKRVKYNTKLQKSSSIALEQATVTLGSLLHTDQLQLAMEYLNLATVFPVPQRTAIFHTRRILKELLSQYQLLPECLACATLDDLRRLLVQVQHYQKNPAAFQYDTTKAAAEQQALERKRREEGKRKEYEARMIRKAKREQLPLDTYLKEGTELPTAALVQQLQAMPRHEALAIWKRNHKQHCLALHLDGECPRARTCAFLHVECPTANAFVETDAVAG